MRFIEIASDTPRGRYRDVLRRPCGEVEGGAWRDNAIVLDCRRVLASFMAGEAAAGIQGMLVGTGLPAWDVGGPPAAAAGQTALVDPHPFLVPASDLQVDFIDAAGAVSAAPTNRIQIVATLGAGEPSWPDANHAAASLREFGLVAQLGGGPALINYVTHPVINKDAASTLERTVWLVF